MSGWGNQSRHKDKWSQPEHPRDKNRNRNGDDRWGNSSHRNRNNNGNWNQGQQRHSDYDRSHSSQSSTTSTRRPHEGRVTVVKTEEDPSFHSDQEMKQKKKRRNYDDFSQKDDTTKKVKTEDTADGSDAVAPVIKIEESNDSIVKREESTSTALVVRADNTSIVKIEESCDTVAVIEELELTPEQWKKKLLDCYRFNQTVEYLPKEALIPDSRSTIEKKRKAATFAVDKVMAKMRRDAEIAMQKDADESDSDDSMYSIEAFGSRPSDHFPYTKDNIEYFFTRVMDCIPLTISFDVTGLNPDDDKHCYCPCDKNMSGWREKYGIEKKIAGAGSPHANRNLCTKGKLTPIGLMSHLRKEGEKCILHYGITHYMEHLYCKNEGSYRGGIGHKAMYQLNDGNWRQADSAHRKTIILEIEAGRKKLEEERKKRLALEAKNVEQANELDLLKRTNKDQVEKLERLEKERKELGVEKKEEVPELHGDALVRYRIAFTGFFDRVKKSAISVQEKKENELDELLVKLPETFDMQDFFDVYYDAPKNKNSASLLFHTLDRPKIKQLDYKRNYHGYKIVNKWNVIFANVATGKNKASKEDTVVDEGGPSREFLAQCWKQVGRLRILKEGPSGKEEESSEEKKKKKSGVKLFDTQDNGTVPQPDAILEYQLTHSFPDKKERDNARERAYSYYRAIGRLMLHALANDHTISASAMPPFYQNWLLRGCSPKDNDYHNDDVLKHLNESGSSKISFYGMIGLEHDFTDDTTEVITNENIFTKLIPDQFIHSRNKAFKAIQEGLTQDGDYFICEFLRSFPLEAVQKVAFSTARLSAEDIIAVLQPVYCSGWEQIGENGKSFTIGTEEDRIEHSRKQETFFKDVLCQILIDREKKMRLKYLSLFVKFCTGYDYIPDKDGNPDFKIIVEFNFTETVENGYPVAYTCVNTLKLPALLYTEGKRGFVKKLNEALKIYGKNFNMN